MKRFASLPVRLKFSTFFITAVLIAMAGGLSQTGALHARGAMPQSAAGANAFGGAAGAAAKPISRIRHATSQVFRLIVEVEGAVKGGTSFLVSGRRVIATNHHVVENGTAFMLGFIGEDGRIQRIPLRLLAIYPQKDLALLEALDDLPSEAMALSTAHPDPATDLFAIGFPAAADPQGVITWTSGSDETFFVPSVIKGYVSRVLPNRWFSSQLQHQTPIIPGYSGGPLVDNDGAVVGISTAVHKEANGISYGALAADLAEFAIACGLPVSGDAPRPGYEAHRQMLPAAPAAIQTYIYQPGPAMSRENDGAMLARANAMLWSGDIVAARLVFEFLIAQRRMPEAAAGLARSYDPAFLRERNVLGLLGDQAKAAALYRKAADLGSEEAKRALNAVAAGSCRASMCKLVSSESGPMVRCERDQL